MAHPTRLKSFDYVGLWRYFVTSCTHERRPLFRDSAIVATTIGQFRRASSDEQCEVLAYCYMPDHAHFLISGATLNAALPRFLKRAKQLSGHRYSKEQGGKLWQVGYHDRVLRNDETTPQVIKYIVSNPVRAGLVARPDDYPFWGSDIYSRREILEFVQHHACWVP